jgi:GTP-binding protein YchF
MKVALFVIMMACILSVSGRCSAFASRSAFTRSGNPVTIRSYSRSTLTMKLQTAIVGLPNVGKSTLFNALTESQGAEAANYPFCTIESNVGIVTVPDIKLQKLSVINKSVKTVPATLEFVDVAGLIKGASKGEGLGNKFLASIRQADAVVHVVRCFEDDDVIHVDGSVDPIRDAELVNLELAFADLDQVEVRLQRVKKEKKPDPVEAKALEKVMEVLLTDRPARFADLDAEEEKAIKSLGLLSRKKMIYAANVADSDLAEGNEMVDKLRELAESEGAKMVIVSAQVEAELVELSDEERADFLESLGVTMENSGLRALVKEAYDLLELQTYYTSGPTETRAWTIQKGWTAPKAAGVIHNDFERGFIRAETISYKDLIECGSEAAAKSKGLLRSEGKEYIVQEDDVMLFRFNV